MSVSRSSSHMHFLDLDLWLRIYAMFHPDGHSYRQTMTCAHEDTQANEGGAGCVPFNHQFFLSCSEFLLFRSFLHPKLRETIIDTYVAFENPHFVRQPAFLSTCISSCRGPLDPTE